jgi:dolichyl-phosphate beta-glucosyltransferase
MISVIIPAHNEEERIARAITMVADSLPGIEIIVVSDGNDRTAERAGTAKPGNASLRVISYSRRIGKWGSICRGIREAIGDPVCFIDADLSVSPREARRLLSVLSRQGCDVVMSSRYVSGASIVKRQPLSRVLLSRAFNLIASIPFFLRFRDTQCGFKAFRAGTAKRVSGMMKCRGFEGDVEFLWLAKRSGALIREEPVTWTDSGNSSLRFYHIFMMLIGIVKSRIHWLLK